MSRQYVTCPHCFQPVPDNRLFCTEYREHFRSLLRRTPEMLRELNVTLSKQDRISSGSTGGSRPKGHEKPLVYKMNASIARDKLLAGTVVKWARFVREHFVRLFKPAPDLLGGIVLPTDPIALLIALSERSANYPWFEEMVGDLDDAFAAGEAAIDVAEGRLEAGTCEHCGTRVRGHLDSPTYTCSGCGFVGDIVERQAELWDAAMKLLVTPAQAEVYLTYFIRLEVLRKAEGLPGVLAEFEEETPDGVKYRTPKGGLISLWANRHHLREGGRFYERGLPGMTEDGWALFVLGDIVDLALTQLRKADERKAAGAARRAAVTARRAAREQVEAA